MKRLLRIVFFVLLITFISGAKPRPVHVLMAGDSTMADKVLAKTVKDSVSGESFEEPFLERGWGHWWSKIIDNVQPGDYPDIIRAVARENKTAFIDMEKLTSEWLQSTGVEASAKFFHEYPPGLSRLYPNRLDDNTYFNEAGARMFAKMFVEEAAKIRKMSKIINK